MGRIRLRPWQVVAAVLAAIAAVWRWGTALVDFIDHVALFARFSNSEGVLKQNIARFIERHPEWANEFGPYVLMGCAILLFVSPYVAPTVSRRLGYLLSNKDFDEPKGWSVSIWTSRGTTGQRYGDVCTIFFPMMRFVNVSTVRRRILDVEIKIPYRDNSMPSIYLRSWEYNKSQYQLTMEEKKFDLSDHRGMNILSFPLEIEASAQVEGSFVFQLQSPFTPRNLDTWMMDMDISSMSFEFIDRTSLRHLRIGINQQYDAVMEKTELLNAKLFPRFMYWKRLIARVKRRLGDSRKNPEPPPQS